MLVVLIASSGLIASREVGFWSWIWDVSFCLVIFQLGFELEVEREQRREDTYRCVVAIFSFVMVWALVEIFWME